MLGLALRLVGLALFAGAAFNVQMLMTDFVRYGNASGPLSYSLFLEMRTDFVYAAVLAAMGLLLFAAASILSVLDQHSMKLHDPYDDHPKMARVPAPRPYEESA